MSISISSLLKASQIKKEDIFKEARFNWGMLHFDDIRLIAGILNYEVNLCRLEKQQALNIARIIRDRKTDSNQPPIYVLKNFLNQLIQEAKQGHLSCPWLVAEPALMQEDPAEMAAREEKQRIRDEFLREEQFRRMGAIQDQDGVWKIPQPHP